MDGLLVIDKPAGMTSHDVVQAIRKRFGTRKVGHLGTLDPMATGVLPVTVGSATRLAQFLPASPKEYTGEIRFGFSTNTYDREGSPTSGETPLDRNADEVRERMRSLTGAIDHVPPPFSAKKVGGVPAYKLARASRNVEIAPVRIEVERFELLGFEPPFAEFRVVCSGGTYVRGLAHKLGQLVGCGAHLTALRRTRSGDFPIGNATTLERIRETDLVPMHLLLISWPKIEVSGTDEVKVLHGNQIRAVSSGNLVRIFNKKGEFIALASVESGWARPRLVLTSINSD